MTENAPLPAQIQKQVDAGKKAQEDHVQGKAAPVAAKPQPTNPPAVPAPTSTPQPQPVAKPAPPEGASWDQVRHLPTPELEQRYRSMHGRIARYENEISTLRKEVQQMQGRLAAQPPAPATPAPAAQAQPPAPSEPPKPWYSQEQLEEFGPDFFELVDRRIKMAEATTANQFKQVQEENKQLREQVQKLGGSVQKAQTQPLYLQLSQRFPDWEKLDNDPDFLAWAGATPVSKFTSVTMLDALRQKFKEGDLDTVVEIFKAYQPQGSTAPQPNMPPEGQPPAASVPPAAQPAQIPPVNLQNLAGPGAPQVPAGDLLEPATGRVWTDQAIANYYEARRRGTITEERAQQLEADLQQAISPAGRQAGRYRPR